MGFDPLIQFVHEEDVLRAFQLALENNFNGTFNIVGNGVLPLLTLLRISGRIALSVPSVFLYPMTQALWQTNFGVVPPAFLDYLKYLCVADGQKAKDQMGFVPQYSTRDTLLSFVGEQRLREVHLFAA
jgi:UDP-glucose 4-epimerase